ncbi:hypothetical protein LTR12_001330 [Friedmanniomyces endolithicus]|nr:hypothetical protein LTR74_001480 [Friedmanniomyces endolithicus]KAK1824264.1 hypothetical protein LTR12_001330 [Friedmanniomyces endolithicus]
MNRSKATATTLCQKCLKRGHFSYECTASKQDRPYVSRPSRTQQLLNPELAPKIVEATKPAAAEAKPNPKGVQKADDVDGIRSKRRSASYSSTSDSVSTISTRSSQSPSPPPRRIEGKVDSLYLSYKEQSNRQGLPASKRPRSRSPLPSSGNIAQESRTSRDRHRSRSPFRTHSREQRPSTASGEPVSKVASSKREERSLSPYSRRIALTGGNAKGR